MKPEPRQPFAFALDAEAAHLAANPWAATPTEGIEATAGLHQVVGSHDAAITVLPGTATLARKTAPTNTLSPGDRWAALAALIHLEVEIIDVPDDQPIQLDAIDRRLGHDVRDAIRAVLVTHVKTGTGAVADVAGVRRALDESFHDALQARAAEEHWARGRPDASREPRRPQIAAE